MFVLHSRKTGLNSYTLMTLKEQIQQINMFTQYELSLLNTLLNTSSRNFVLLHIVLGSNKTW